MQLPFEFSLNNRWIVTGLLACASGLVYWNVAPYLFPPDADSMIYAEDDDDDWMAEAEREIAEVRFDLRTVSASQIRWEERQTRDPFRAPTTQQREDSSGTVVTNQPALSTTAPPTLDALVSGTDSRFAVINGQILSEGDYWAQFRVQSITAAGVVLASPSNNVVLTVN